MVGVLYGWGDEVCVRTDVENMAEWKSRFGFSNFVCATVEQRWIMLYAARIIIWGVTSPTAVHETTVHDEIEGIPEANDATSRMRVCHEHEGISNRTARRKTNITGLAF